MRIESLSFTQGITKDCPRDSLSVILKKLLYRGKGEASLHMSVLGLEIPAVKHISWWKITANYKQIFQVNDFSALKKIFFLIGGFLPGESHGLQHSRLPCPSPTPGAYSNSYPSSWWCYQTISPSVIPSPLTFNLSQNQGLFQWVSSLHQVTKVLEFQLQHQSFQWIFKTENQKHRFL